MPTYAVPGEMLTGIANAIRSKTGSDEQMPVSAMAAAIEGISGGGFEEVVIPYAADMTADNMKEYLKQFIGTDNAVYVRKKIIKTTQCMTMFIVVRDVYSIYAYSSETIIFNPRSTTSNVKLNNGDNTFVKVPYEH